MRLLLDRRLAVQPVSGGAEPECVPASGGAGVQTAQFLADRGVKAVITGNVGPNAIRVLNAAGISVYVAPACMAKEALAMFLCGELRRVSSATVDSHYG